jgi:dCTP deaminase
MSVLLASEIKKAVEKGEIKIYPYNEAQVEPNGYGVTLGSKLLVPNISKYDMQIWDCAKEITYDKIEIQEDGFWLLPNVLYLAVTNERTYTPHHVPQMQGKSSLGRMGMDIHICAGAGEIGFDGYWTLEIRVMYPTRIYPNMPIGSLWFFETKGDEVGYEHFNPSYNKQPCQPMPTRFFSKFKNGKLK